MLVHVHIVRTNVSPTYVYCFCQVFFIRIGDFTDKNDMEHEERIKIKIKHSSIGFWLFFPTILCSILSLVVVIIMALFGFTHIFHLWDVAYSIFDFYWLSFPKEFLLTQLQTVLHIEHRSLTNRSFHEKPWPQTFTYLLHCYGERNE